MPTTITATSPTGTAYAKAANYTEREQIVRDLATYELGLWYALQYETDSRIPSAVRSAALTYYWDANHFTDTDGVLPIHFPSHTYVREMRRMIGPLVWTANDIKAADGSAPRLTKTIGLASYPIDSHYMRAYADPNGGSPRIMLEGSFFDSEANGPNHISPLPYEIITPKKAECENLLVGFSVSCTHAAFGSIRMEETAKLMAQSGALALCLAMENGDVAVQDVDYPTLRARILGADANPQSLPQVN